jgi:hypothetical protein
MIAAKIIGQVRSAGGQIAVDGADLVADRTAATAR